ncbi:MAG: NADH:ubiquinone reductase (Na(+)-transporting) subunit B [Gammaproteobacteria bacterium]
MNFLKKQLDQARPSFQAGGRFESLYPLFDVLENFLFSSQKVTSGRTHLRDGADVQRIMAIVWVATFPAMFWGVWNLGHLSLVAMEAAGISSVSDWHAIPIELLGGYQAGNLWHELWFGLCYFVPIYMVTFGVGIAWEAIFAIVRGHEINEGFFVTSVLFALCCPPDVPLWQVALGISFGVVIAKEIFGGTGKNFINPALAGRAFLYLAYPASWTGDTIWLGADGVSAATPLGLAAEGGLQQVQQHYSLAEVALGTIPGSIGETSLIAIGIGAAILLYTRIASWRIMAGVILGMTLTSLLFYWSSSSSAVASIPPHWHFAMGGLAFGMVFMATEPVSAANTALGRWIYGAIIGAMVILIRVLNPGFPEGMMLAILFANLCAPLIDHLVTESSLKRRLGRIEQLYRVKS